MINIIVDVFLIYIQAKEKYFDLYDKVVYNLG